MRLVLSGALTHQLVVTDPTLPTPDADALLVSDLTNIRWLTGYTGSNGWVVLVADPVSRTLELVQTDGHAMGSWEAVPLLVPNRGWDLVQVGNCGSPVETDRGWLVLTHGVGPMRRYAIGAMLPISVGISSETVGWIGTAHCSVG